MVDPDRVAAHRRGAIWEASQAENRTGASPMKAFLDFVVSLLAIKSDGDAGAVLLREH